MGGDYGREINVVGPARAAAQLPKSARKNFGNCFRLDVGGVAARQAQHKHTRPCLRPTLARARATLMKEQDDEMTRACI